MLHFDPTMMKLVFFSFNFKEFELNQAFSSRMVNSNLAFRSARPAASGDPESTWTVSSAYEVPNQTKYIHKHIQISDKNICDWCKCKLHKSRHLSQGEHNRTNSDRRPGGVAPPPNPKKHTPPHPSRSSVLV